MSAIVVAVVVSVAAIVGYSSYLIFGPDNQVEEVCEEIIKVETGTTVDLSPNEQKNEPKLEQSPVVSQAPGQNGASENAAPIALLPL